MRTQLVAKTLAAVAIAATGLVVATAPAYASIVTRDDLEKKGFECERAGAGGWKCKKLGDVWLCPNEREGPCIDLPGLRQRAFQGSVS